MGTRKPYTRRNKLCGVKSICFYKTCCFIVFRHFGRSKLQFHSRRLLPEFSIVTNSFNAHRFTHFAKQYGKQNEAEEALFHAHFTGGKNIDDYAVLTQLGTAIGLDAATLKTALESGSYTVDVKADMEEAQEVGVRGVPFFVFNRKFAVSGAQDSSVFLQVLEKSFAEWEQTKQN